MYTCDDCSNSYYVPGQNSPLVISGGCPECGGHLRPERDQPGGTASDGTYRDNFAQDGSSAHNPEGEGILENRSKKDNSFPSMMSSNESGPVRVRNDMSLSASNQHPQMPWTHNDEEVKYMFHHVAGPLAALPLVGDAAGAIGGALGLGGADAAAGAASAGGGLLSGPVGGAMGAALTAGRTYSGVHGLEGLLGLNNNGESGGNAGPMGAQQMPVNNYLSQTHTALDFPGGGTAGDSTKNQEKPEEVDPKEHDDSPDRLDDITDETVGVDGARKDFDPSGHAIARFKILLPLVKQYASSEEDGSQDPLIQALHEILEQELPGYLGMGDEGKGDEHEVELHDQHGEDHLEKESEDPESKESAASPIGMEACSHCGAMMAPGATTCPQCGAQSGAMGGGVMAAAFPSMIGPQSPEEESLQSQNWPRAELETCPHCGAFAKSALGGCVHCGADIHEFRPPHVGANHQGPHSPEQIAAVQQLLIDSGRVQEVPNVPIHPWEYADEMSQVSQVDEPPSPDMTTQPPMPAQEETPPDAGMPVPGMSMPPGQSSTRSAADSAAPQCPNCDSHTTGTANEEGDCECHTCGHRWKVNDTLVESKVVSSHRWATSDGQPLQQDQSYELHTPDVSIPDIVKVKQLKPDGVVLEFTGAHNMSFEKEVTAQEAELEQYAFQPVRGLEAHNDAPLSREEPQAADYDKDVTYTGDGIGDNHQVTTSWNKIDEGDTVGPAPQRTIAQMIAERRASAPQEVQEEVNLEDHPDRNWLYGEGETKTAGAKYSPFEQRELIDEEGVARNSDKMDLANTHYQRQTAVSELDMVIGW